MKAFLVLIAFIYVQSVSAVGVTPINNQDVSLSQAKGKILSVSELCPVVPGRMSCQAIGSRVIVNVALHGCLDRLGGYFSRFEEIDGEGVLYFGAVNIFNNRSRSARCAKAPEEKITITVPFEGRIKLVNIEYTGSIQPQY